jgi:hypothetical protein
MVHTYYVHESRVLYLCFKVYEHKRNSSWTFGDVIWFFQNYYTCNQKQTVSIHVIQCHSLCRQPVPYYCWAPKKVKNRIGYLTLPSVQWRNSWKAQSSREFKPTISDCPYIWSCVFSCRKLRKLKHLSLETYRHSEWGRCMWVTSTTATSSIAPHEIWRKIYCEERDYHRQRHQTTKQEMREDIRRDLQEGSRTEDREAKSPSSVRIPKMRD